MMASIENDEDDGLTMMEVDPTDAAMTHTQGSSGLIDRIKLCLANGKKEELSKIWQTYWVMMLWTLEQATEFFHWIESNNAEEQRLVLEFVAAIHGKESHELGSGWNHSDVLSFFC